MKSKLAKSALILLLGISLAACNSEESQTDTNNTDQADEAADNNRESEDNEQNNFETYSSEEFGYTIQYPTDWKVYEGEIDPSAVTFTSPEIDFDQEPVEGEVPEGFLASVMGVDYPEDKTKDEAVEEMKTRLADEGMEMNEVEVNGETAYEFSMDVPLDETITMKSKSYVVPSESKMFLINGSATSQENSDMYIEKFEEMVNSFKVM